MASLEWRLSVMEVVGHPPLSCRGKLIGIALAGRKAVLKGKFLNVLVWLCGKAELTTACKVNRLAGHLLKGSYVRQSSYALLKDQPEKQI